MLLSIIIISYNTQDVTLQTLESVLSELKASALLRHQTEVFIVDNASQDGSVAALSSWIAKQGSSPCQWSLIKNKENVGFAKANNLALQRATGEYILLLNSDTIVQPGALEKLVQAFIDRPVNDRTSALNSQHGKLDRLGILASQLVNVDGSFQPQGGSFPTLFSLSSHMLMLDDIPLLGRWLPSTQHTGLNARVHKHSSHPRLIQQDWVGGTAMMIRRAVIDEIGPLDQNIFMYGEDIEFCLRARAHQWDIAIDPSAKIIHFGSASSSSVNAIIGEFKGYLYIWSKHQPLWQLPLAKFILSLGARLRILVFGTICRNRQKAHSYVDALKVVLR